MREWLFTWPVDGLRSVAIVEVAVEQGRFDVHVGEKGRNFELQF